MKFVIFFIAFLAVANLSSAYPLNQEDSELEQGSINTPNIRPKRQWASILKGVASGTKTLVKSNVRPEWDRPLVGNTVSNDYEDMRQSSYNGYNQQQSYRNNGYYQPYGNNGYNQQQSYSNNGYNQQQSYGNNGYNRVYDVIAY